MSHNSAKPPAPPASVLMLTVLFLVAFTGYLKGTLVLRWLPLDVTIPLVLALLAMVTWRYLRWSTPKVLLAPVIWFAIASLFGLVSTWTAGADLYKSAYLYLITIPAVWAAASLLSSDVALRRWALLTVAFSVLMAFAVLVDPNVDYGATYGRLTSQGTSPISAARILLAGSLLCITFALNRGTRFRFVHGIVAVILAVLALQAGSKGPVASAVLALALVVITARGYRGRRSNVIVAGAAAVGITAFLVRNSESRGISRIVAFFGDDSEDAARESLWSAAVQIAERAPLGVGWGQFAAQPEFPSTFSSDAYVHNIYLETLSESGWIAFVALITFTAVCLRRLWRGSERLVGTQVYLLAVYWLLAAQVSGDINGNRSALMLLAAGLAVQVQQRASTSARQSERSKQGVSLQRRP